jgi:hypothetical protein
MASISMLSWIAKQRQTLYLNTIPPERRSTPPAPEGLASDQDADHYLEYTGLHTYKARPVRVAPLIRSFGSLSDFFV